MLKFFSKLSVFCWFCFWAIPAKADSFLLSQSDTENVAQEQIIPLIYVKNLEYYNHKKTSAYTQNIKDKLSLESKIIIIDDEKMADFYIVPQLLQSHMESFNQDVSRYSMSINVELWSKGGILIDNSSKTRYIVIESSENAQQVAKKLLIKLLDEALTELMHKIKNNQLIGS